ncbi:MAG: DUF3137 domain-containing protein [Bacteroides sp.]|nr:DUF3137 domain-containing protein [Bacteroides sp.]MCM1550321.1 DUF3137 domain-containing protein [Clostridium sp.]
MEGLNLDIAGVQKKMRKFQRLIQAMHILKGFFCFGVTLLALGPALCSTIAQLILSEDRANIWVPALEPIFTYGSMFIGGLSLVLLIVVIFTEGRFKKRYFDQYKELLQLEKILNTFFDDVVYSPEQGLTRGEFEQTGVYLCDRGHYRSEDLITASYQGIDFKQSDVELYTYTGGKHKRKVVYVDGRVAQFHYKKEIRGKILIASKGFVPKTATVFANGEPVYTQKEKEHIGDMGIVSMEDMDFNDKFTVYTSDPHSAYYFLTPHVMEYMKGLWGMDAKISISFDGEYLNILRSGSGGIFEPPLHGNIDISKQLRVIEGELQEIVRCIEALRLDEKQQQMEELEEALHREEKQEKEAEQIQKQTQEEKRVQEQGAKQEYKTAFKLKLE